MGTERQYGYYWVRDYDYWYIAKWSNNEWTVCGNERPFGDLEFDEINENRIINSNNE